MCRTDIIWGALENPDPSASNGGSNLKIRLFGADVMAFEVAGWTRNSNLSWVISLLKFEILVHPVTSKANMLALKCRILRFDLPFDVPGSKLLMTTRTLPLRTWKSSLKTTTVSNSISCPILDQLKDWSQKTSWRNTKWLLTRKEEEIFKLQMAIQCIAQELWTLVLNLKAKEPTSGRWWVEIWRIRYYLGGDRFNDWKSSRMNFQNH